MDKRNGFTLVELLIFLCVVALTSSLLLATYLSGARENIFISRRQQLHQATMNCLNYYIGERNTVGFDSPLLDPNQSSATPKPAICQSNGKISYQVKIEMVQPDSPNGDIETLANYKKITVTTRLAESNLQQTNSTIIAEY